MATTRRPQTTVPPTVPPTVEQQDQQEQQEQQQDPLAAILEAATTALAAAQPASRKGRAGSLAQVTPTDPPTAALLQRNRLAVSVRSHGSRGFGRAVTGKPAPSLTVPWQAAIATMLVTGKPVPLSTVLALPTVAGFPPLTGHDGPEARFAAFCGILARITNRRIVVRRIVSTATDQPERIDLELYASMDNSAGSTGVEGDD